MNLLGVKKIQRCLFKGTSPVISGCTPKGTTFALLSESVNSLSLRPAFVNC